MATRKVPKSELEFIRRCNKLRDQEHKGHRWVTIRVALRDFIETINEGRPQPMNCYVEAVVALYRDLGLKRPPDVVGAVRCRDVGELESLAVVAQYNANAIWDREEDASVLLRYQPATTEGQLAKLDLCFETLAVPEVTDDHNFEVAAVGRAVIAELRQPAVAARKAA